MDHFPQRGFVVRDRFPHPASVLMRRAILMVQLCLAAAPAVAGQGQAPERFYGRPIASWHLEIADAGAERRVESAPAILQQVTLAVGDVLRPRDVRDSIDRLYQTGKYDDVQVLASEMAAGLDVVFVLVPRHPVDRLDFIASNGGSTGLPKDTFDRVVKQQFGGLPPSTRTAAAQGFVERLLHDEGYLRASVKTSIQVTHNPDRATLVFDIDAGVQARVGAVHVTPGVRPLSDQTIIRQAGASVGAPFVPRAINAALAGIESSLRAREYFGAKAWMRSVAPSSDGSTVSVELSVESGPPVKIVPPKPEEMPKGGNEWLPVYRERSIDEDVLEDTDRAIKEALHRDGYWHAEASHTTALVGNVTVVTLVSRKGLRYLVDAPEISGNQHIVTTDIMLALGLVAGEPFDQARVDRGVSRVRGMYRDHGFAAALVTPESQEAPGATPPGGDGRVLVTLTIVEGPETRVGAVRFVTTGKVSDADLRNAMKLRTGSAFVQAQVDVDRRALEQVCQDRGYRKGVVTITSAFPGDGSLAMLTVDVTEGLQEVVSTISVIGSHRISDDTIREWMTIHQGDPLSATKLDDSKRALIEKGSFRTVEFSATEPNADGRVELIVRLDEAPATTIGIGGGVSGQSVSQVAVGGGVAQHVEFAPRGFFDVSRRNVGGKNRTLTFSSSISLRPPVSTDPTQNGQQFGFGEYHVNTTYRAFQALGPRTDLSFGTTFEQAPRTTYNFTRKSVHADLQRQGWRQFNLLARYSLEYTKVSDVTADAGDQLLISRLFANARLSIISGGVVRDRRDDPIDPSQGVFVSAEGDLATRHVLGSQLGFAKSFMEASVFHRVGKADSWPRVVLAGRAELGLAMGFPHVVTSTDADGNVVTETSTDMPVSQRFFAGGSNSVRGFNVDQLGTPAVLDVNGLSNGGNGLIILNGEVRTTVLRNFLNRGGSLGVVGFLDAGNVFQRATDIAIGELRTSAGFGVRWKSPIGPLRLDLGFKLHPRVIAGQLESRTGWHFSIGEAF
jgi:outer membrane protein assembly complex protein YaeT